MSSEQTLHQALADRPAMSKFEPEYRLYYNSETGEPDFYTMEQHEGTYITVTAEQFAIGNYQIRVVDGELVPFELPTTVLRLQVSDEGVPTDPNNILIVDPTSSTKWSLQECK